MAHLSAATARSHHEQPLPLVHPACRMRQHHRPPAASTPTPPATMVAASCLISPLPASHLPLLALPNASALADATAPSRHPTVTTRRAKLTSSSPLLRHEHHRRAKVVASSTSHQRVVFLRRGRLRADNAHPVESDATSSSPRSSQCRKTLQPLGW
jgi:hypothetical protein